MSTKRISISCAALASRYGQKEALEICAKSGFDAVDFGLENFGVRNEPVYQKSDEEIIDHFKALKARADELGLMISQTHGRCTTYTPEEEYNKWVRWVCRRDLLATAAIGAPACVIHSITTSRWQDADADFMHKKNKELFDYLIPYAEEYGVSFALETFGDSKANGQRVIDFFGDVHELKKQYDMLDTKNKMLCMDTGHTHKAHCVKPSVLGTVDAIRYLGSDIKLLHLNDNNSYSDQHLPPYYAGSELGLDWKAIFEALDDIGYDGVYNFEITLGHYGKILDEAVAFLGKYLRRCVDGTIK